MHQQSIRFQKQDKNKKFVDHDILLTDAIYAEHIPKEAKGKYFRYSATVYNSQTKMFTVKYKNKTIDPDEIFFMFSRRKKDMMMMICRF